MRYSDPCLGTDRGHYHQAA